MLKLIPRPDTQDVAVRSVLKHFKTHDRAMLVAGTGYGKTLTSMWAMERYKPTLAVIFAPTIDLLDQIVSVYRVQMSLKVENWLGVCSRSIHGDAVAVPHVTDEESIVRFLKLDGRSFIFCTYASAPVLAKAILRSKRTVCWATMDEGHHVAGSEDKVTALLTKDKCLPISKRLFVTATPKHISFSERDEMEAFSMDNEQMFGPRVYEMSYREAVKAEIVLPVRVFITTSQASAKTIATLTEENRFRAYYDGLKKFQKTSKSRKCLCKHSTIREAARFAEYLNRRGMMAHTISSETPQATRKALISAVASTTDVIVTYAECLNEGIDFPSVDAVCFLSAVRSTRTIVQVVGRCVRLHPGKTHGNALLLALCNDEGDIYSSSYHQLGATLAALCESDSVINDEVKAIGNRDGDVELDAGVRTTVHFDPSLSIEVATTLSKRIRFRMERPDHRWGTVEEWREHWISLGRPVSTKYDRIRDRSRFPASAQMHMLDGADKDFTWGIATGTKREFVRGVTVEEWREYWISLGCPGSVEYNRRRDKSKFPHPNNLYLLEGADKSLTWGVATGTARLNLKVTEDDFKKAWSEAGSPMASVWDEIRPAGFPAASNMKARFGKSWGELTGYTRDAVTKMLLGDEFTEEDFKKAWLEAGSPTTREWDDARPGGFPGARGVVERLGKTWGELTGNYRQCAEFTEEDFKKAWLEAGSPTTREWDDAQPAGFPAARTIMRQLKKAWSELTGYGPGKRVS